MLVNYGPILIDDADFLISSDTDDANIQAAVMLNLLLVFSRIIGNIGALKFVEKRGRRQLLVMTLPILMILMTLIGVCTSIMRHCEETPDISAL